MKFIDMFAGIGGFRSGLEKAGHQCVGYIEWDKYARKSYQAIYDTKGEYTENDIKEVKGIELPEADIWTFGSPCQDISIAGKQTGIVKGERSSMFFEVIRLLEKAKKVGISDTQLYKQAGNAVTVDVIEQIGKRLVLEDDETMIAYVLEKHYEQD